MRRWAASFPWVFLLAGEAARAQPAADPAVAALIRQLGDASFQKREAAGKELAKIGEKVLPQLMAAAETHADPEVQRRAKLSVVAVMRNLTKSRSTGLETVAVEPGAFQMGSPQNEQWRKTEEILHRVQITRPYWIGKYEVTQAEYEKVTRAKPSWFSPTGGGKAKVAGLETEKFPVERVTWFDAVAFCNLLSKADGYEPYYQLADEIRDAGPVTSATVKTLGGAGYRLPTEAEWEFACRGGTDKPFHFGTENTGKEANTQPGPATGYGGGPDWRPLNRPAAVGSYPANFHGLHDMHGNVAEWCHDWYDRTYAVDAPVKDPPGPATGKHRALRGGSWTVTDGASRSASRYWLTPGAAENYAGFRVARSP